ASLVVLLGLNSSSSQGFAKVASTPAISLPLFNQIPRIPFQNNFLTTGVPTVGFLDRTTATFHQASCANDSCNSGNVISNAWVTNFATNNIPFYYEEARTTDNSVGILFWDSLSQRVK